MLRLLFTNVEQDKQLTVITDGIDGQMNVFVTENVVGDIDFYKSIGIDINPGISYNIGKLKEWALENFLKLVGYPEGLDNDPIVFVDNAERWEYNLSCDDPNIEFPKEGGMKILPIQCNKQKLINGKEDGKPVAVNYTTTVSGAGFSKGNTEYSVNAEANSGEAREGSAVVKSSEGNKTITITLSQEAGTTV